jgi:hypothetical protein
LARAAAIELSCSSASRSAATTTTGGGQAPRTHRRHDHRTGSAESARTAAGTETIALVHLAHAPFSFSFSFALSLGADAARNHGRRVARGRLAGTTTSSDTVAVTSFTRAFSIELRSPARAGPGWRQIVVHHPLRSLVRAASKVAFSFARVLPSLTPVSSFAVSSISTLAPLSAFSFSMSGRWRRCHERESRWWREGRRRERERAVWRERHHARRERHAERHGRESWPRGTKRTKEVSNENRHRYMRARVLISAFELTGCVHSCGVFGRFAIAGGHEKSRTEIRIDER